MRLEIGPFSLTVSKCYTAYQGSASTAFATEAAGKVGHCTSISLHHSLCTHAVKSNATACYKQVVLIYDAFDVFDDDVLHGGITPELQ